MIRLTLDSINAKAPYKVWMSDAGQYRFQTDLGINYAISFEEDQPIGDCETYQFIINKLEHQRSPHDAKVRETILTIVDEFFASYMNVMLYLCDDSDGREANRNRLFLRWFESHAQPNRFSIRTANTTIEGRGFYAAIIVENRNPKLHNIIRDFEYAAETLTANKP